MLNAAAAPHCGVTQMQRCVIEDLDLSTVKDMPKASMASVTFTRVVFKGASLPVRPRFKLVFAFARLLQALVEGCILLRKVLRHDVAAGHELQRVQRYRFRL
jgi:hypothetical protein